MTTWQAHITRQSAKFALQTLVGNVQIPELAVRLVGTHRTGDRLIVANYDATILELQGEVRSENKFNRVKSSLLQLHMRCACIGNELFVMFCFNGRPEMRIRLQCTDSATVMVPHDAARITTPTCYARA